MFPILGHRSTGKDLPPHQNARAKHGGKSLEKWYRLRGGLLLNRRGPSQFLVGLLRLYETYTVCMYHFVAQRVDTPSALVSGTMIRCAIQQEGAFFNVKKTVPQS